MKILQEKRCIIGEGLDVLAITTASLSAKLDEDPSAGFTILQKVGTRAESPICSAP